LPKFWHAKILASQNIGKKLATISAKCEILTALGSKPSVGKKIWQFLPSKNVVGLLRIWQPTNQTLYYHGR